MKRIGSSLEWTEGAHGVVLDSGEHRALLLPQVATERGMTRQQFFSCLARKAGARPNVYSDPKTRLRVFRAQVFGRSVQ
jgi:AMMECR1 domain-containing protein